MNAEELAGGVRANPRRTQAAVVAVADGRGETLARAVDGVRTPATVARPSRRIQLRPDVIRIVRAAEHVPLQTIVSSWCHLGHGIEEHAHGSGSAIHGIR